jgi:hypothetical protein
VVNGPGEADLRIAAGKGFGHLIVKGEVKGKVPEDRFVEVLVAEAGKMAPDTTASDAKRSRPSCILMIQRLGSGSRATKGESETKRDAGSQAPTRGIGVGILPYRVFLRTAPSVRPSSLSIRTIS